MHDHFHTQASAESPEGQLRKAAHHHPSAAQLEASDS